MLATSSISMHVVEDGPQHQEVDDVPPVLGPEHRSRPRPHPVGDPRGRRPQPHHDRAAAVRILDAHTGCRPAPGAGACRVRHRPHPDRHRAAADGRLGQRGNGTQFTSAVTSHTLWFHRPFRTDEWLLLRQHSPLLAHGRCFGRGDVLTEDGVLVASYGQEALLTVRDMSRRQNEKRVLLSGEYKLPKSDRHIDTHAALVTEL